MTLSTRMKLKGGWIDATYTPGLLIMAAVGPPLQHLVKSPTSIPARHKQTEERGRLRRLAVEALIAAGAPEETREATVEWTYRAG